MAKYCSLLFSISLLLSLVIISQSAEICNPNDKKALLQIKAQLGPNTQFFSSWQPNTDCCKSWINVGCDSQSGRVTILTIGQTNELSGSIPLAVGELTGLERLWFNDLPGLTGQIPSVISNLVNLDDLELFRTNLTGPIPSFLGRLQNLTILDLSENRLSGPIPASLFLLTKLEQLNLYKNRLTGSIPTSFSSFKRLSLQAYENQLSGSIPNNLGQAGFTWLDLSNNRLTGDASFLFGGSKKRLVLINLKNNALSFDFSKVVFSTKLQGLDVSHNMIYGSIPKQVAQLPLQLFNVSYNQLCGPIPSGKWVTQFQPDAFEHNKCLCGAPLAACK